MKTNRYPGVKPFSSEEQAIFFGRDRDIADLCDLVRVEKTCVLFGKSGYGKSSLLQAGVLPRLAPVFQPIEVRFGEYIAGQSLHPLENLRTAISKRGQAKPEMAFVEALPVSLWTHFKKYSGPDSPGYLLVFDQFEEFFSYPPEQQRAFREQLAELLNDEMPENLREAARELPREQRRLLALAPDLRLLLALRSDRLHELDRMKDYLPTLLHKRYELRALSQEQARQAIVGPAILPITNTPVTNPPITTTPITTPHFSSPPFEYTEAALRRILADLTRSNTLQHTGVEAFQLQILCNNIESRVTEGLIPDRDANGLPDVDVSDLPDFAEVFGQYYERRLAQLSMDEQTVARRVIEDGLVRLDPNTGEGRRLSVDGDALLQQFGHQGLTTTLLRALEGTFLLRREPNTLGGYNYELSHDTLLAPITAAAKQRRQREAEELLRLEAEANERALVEERRKLAQARKRTALALALALLAVLASVFAFLKTQEAERAQKEALLQADNARKEKTEAEKQRGLAVISKNAADSSALIALDKTRLAEDALRRADDNLKLAKKEEAKAKALLTQVEQEKNATEVQRQNAEESFLLAEEKTKEAELKAEEARIALEKQKEALANVVLIRLKDADALIYHLDYEGALQKIKSAVALNVAPEAVARSLFEIAFFYYETGQTERADSLAVDIAGLLASSEGVTSSHPLTTAGLKDWKTYKKLSNLPIFRPELDTLLARYYGTLAPIPGGIDTIGSEHKNGLIITVSPFQLATTETTWWQYSLFCTATGYPPPKKPGWGSDGDNPVVNVSWYDAVLYCNWRSARAGLQPAYTIQDSLGRTQDDGWEVRFDSLANGFRLPKEAEWEFAARAGQNTRYAGSEDLTEVGWFGENSGSRTHPVAQKKPNELGLYDMNGNVWEWCCDGYGDYPKGPVKDYQGPLSGSSRTPRGGSWGDDAANARVVSRLSFDPYHRFNSFGFRLARAR
jgi:formylglycine-generating enzyme required for sulfatase activity